MNKLKTCVSNFDQIAELPSVRLHFGDNKSYKTFIGGCCTILAYLCFICFAFYQGQYIYNRTYPNIITQVKPFELFNEKSELRSMKLKSGFKMMLGIISWNGWYDIDKSKIHAFVEEITTKITEQGLEQAITRREVHRCKKEEFKTKYEQGFYKRFGKIPFYCIDDQEEKPILEGNFDSFVRFKKMKQFRWVINYCNGKTRLQGDPECSSDEKIDEWLIGKKVKIFNIDKKIKLRDYEEDFFQTLNLLQSIKLNRNEFTLAEITYRRNKFTKFDSR